MGVVPLLGFENARESRLREKTTRPAGCVVRVKPKRALARRRRLAPESAQYPHMMWQSQFFTQIVGDRGETRYFSVLAIVRTTRKPV
jgi:hypothetical protein